MVLIIEYIKSVSCCMWLYCHPQKIVSYLRREYVLSYFLCLKSVYYSTHYIVGIPLIYTQKQKLRGNFCSKTMDEVKNNRKSIFSSKTKYDFSNTKCCNKLKMQLMCADLYLGPNNIPFWGFT